MGQMSHHHQEAIRKHEAVVVTEEKGCNFCSQPATVDGKTKMGPWANMCEGDFERFGVGLGLGLGQRLIVQHYDPDASRDIRAEILEAIEDGDFDLAEELIGDRDLMEYL